MILNSPHDELCLYHMTLYEVLSIATPVIVIISGGMISYILKTITDSITKLDTKIDSVEDRLNTKIDNVEARLNNRIDNVETRLNNRIDSVESVMDKFDDRLGHVEKELYFLKGILSKISHITE